MEVSSGGFDPPSADLAKGVMIRNAPRVSNSEIKAGLLYPGG